MRLNNAEFKMLTELEKLEKTGKLDPEKKRVLETLREKKASNALEWWGKYPELLKDVVNLAFNYIAGANYPGLITPTAPFYLPGVMRIPYVQTVGYSTDKSSPINIQMYQIWLEMHRKYRGIGAYQMADLGIAIVSIVDVFGELAEAERIYAVANSYKAGNRNIPFTLAHAMNFDLENVSANLADFRYGINLLNRRVRALCLPKGLSMLENRTTLNTGIFKDSSNERGQIFFWDTEYFMKYEASRFSTGGSITYVKHSVNSSGLRTVATILKDLTDQVEALILDDDIARICSDILAAYGENGIESSTEMPEDYSINIVESEERKIQLHNMSFIPVDIGNQFNNDFGVAMNYYSWTAPVRLEHKMDIIQQDNYIFCALAAAGSTAPVISDTLVITFPLATSTELPFEGQPCYDVWKDTPTNEDIMCGTRFTMYATGSARSVSGTPKTIATIDAYGSEVCLAPTIYTKSSNGTISTETVLPWYNENNVGCTRAATEQLTKFDWAPHIYVLNGTGVPNAYTVPLTPRVFGDLDNFVWLSLNSLMKLHEVALLSGFKLNAASVS